MKIHLLIIFFLVNIISHAKYDPKIIAELIDQAEIIGYGEISEFGPIEFTLVFKSVIKGSPLKSIKILKFANWTCASRWTNYKVGEKLLVFLDISDDNSYYALGGGNEGEMPIFDDNLYYKSPYNSLDINATEFSFDSDSLFGYKYSLEEVISIIKNYIAERENYHQISKNAAFKIPKTDLTFKSKIISELKSVVYPN